MNRPTLRCGRCPRASGRAGWARRRRRRRRRSGVTLAELLFAAAAGLLVILVLYGALVFYSRAFTREDDILERSRRSQEVLSLMRDDFERAAGEIGPDDVPAAALAQAGYDRGARAFLVETRTGVNVINAFHDLKAERPYLSRAFGYREAWRWRPVPGTDREELVRDTDRSGWVGEAPPRTIAVGPAGATLAALHVPLPVDRPASEHVLIRKQAGGAVTPVLWTYRREAGAGRHAAGSLLRWTPVSGTVRVGGDQLAAFSFRLLFDHAWADPAPPRRPEPWTQMNKAMLQVHFAFGAAPGTRGADPGFEAGAIMLMGP
jgi:hypothetical protein